MLSCIWAKYNLEIVPFQGPESPRSETKGAWLSVKAILEEAQELTLSVFLYKPIHLWGWSFSFLLLGRTMAIYKMSRLLLSSLLLWQSLTLTESQKWAEEKK